MDEEPHKAMLSYYYGTPERKALKNDDDDSCISLVNGLANPKALNGEYLCSSILLAGLSDAAGWWRVRYQLA